LLRAKCQPLVDSQEFKEILDAPAGDGNKTLRDVISTYNQSIEINKAIIAQAELDVPLSGYTTDNLFTIPLNADGTVDYADTSEEDVTTDATGIDASATLNNPAKSLYVGYLTDDAKTPNGAPYTFGTEFPAGPSNGSFHLRTDYFPNRLFRYDGRHWVKYEDNVRMSLTNLGTAETSVGGTYAGSPVRLNQKNTFVNNNTTATIAGKIIQEKQALSKALRPKADN
jgi:hypothetical protein